MRITTWHSDTISLFECHIKNRIQIALFVVNKTEMDLLVNRPILYIQWLKHIYSMVNLLTWTTFLRPWCGQDLPSVSPLSFFFVCGPIEILLLLLFNNYTVLLTLQHEQSFLGHDVARISTPQLPLFSFFFSVDPERYPSFTFLLCSCLLLYR